MLTDMAQRSTAEPSKNASPGSLLLVIRMFLLDSCMEKKLSKPSEIHSDLLDLNLDYLIRNPTNNDISFRR